MQLATAKHWAPHAPILATYGEPAVYASPVINPEPDTAAPNPVAPHVAPEGVGAANPDTVEQAGAVVVVTPPVLGQTKQLAS